MMSRRGFDLTFVYLDDFLICADSKEVCAQALAVLIQLFWRLGFAIHWGKVVDPTNIITFLGIELDSLTMSLRLPVEKLCILQKELQGFLHPKRATKRQLQSLAGRLSWAASIVKGGRVFLRRIFNQISMLRHPSHRTLLSSMVKKDILWWFQFLSVFNGKSAILDKQSIETECTDACTDAAGGVFGTYWFYFNWSQDWQQACDFNIDEKEVIAITLTAYRWVPLWRNKRIVVYSNNTVSVASINKCTSRNAAIMKCLRSLFWLSARFNFHLTAK